MALKWGIDSLEGLPEPLQGEYKQGEDGKYYPDLELPAGLSVANVEESTAALRSSLASERDATKRLRGNQKRFEGLDPDYARECIEKAEKGLDPKAEDTWKARESQILAKHQEEISGWEKKTKGLTGQLEVVLVKKTALEALTEAGCLPTRTKKLLPHMLQRMKMEAGDNDTFAAITLDKNGNPGVADSAGTAMQPIHLANELKSDPDFAIDFGGTGLRGAGGKGGGELTRQSGRQPWQITEEQAEDRATYLRARAAADKAQTSVEIIDAE